MTASPCPPRRLPVTFVPGVRRTFPARGQDADAHLPLCRRAERRRPRCQPDPGAAAAPAGRRLHWLRRRTHGGGRLPAALPVVSARGHVVPARAAAGAALPPPAGPGRPL